MDSIIDKDVSAKLKYISCACNRVPHCLDWGNNNLVCFGANNSVAIYDTGILPYGKIIQTLHHHNAKVNVVQWIKLPSGGNETEIISASTDGTAIIWSSASNFETFEIGSILEVGEPLSICTSISKDSKSKELLIFLGSINGNFQIWKRSETKETSLMQVLNLNKKLALQAKFCTLSNQNDVLLGIALEDATIRILAQEQSGLVPVAQLIGHEDWVTSLDFTIDIDSKQVLLATGSQDHFIRLWKISLEDKEIEADELRVNKQIFTVNNQSYEITLESVLCGHSGWIYGLHWYNNSSIQQCSLKSIKLLSASLDKSMIIWEYNYKTGIWTESIRVGDVGGNSLGFYGCKFGPDGESILAHGFLGSLYRWKYSRQNDNWVPLPSPTGHFGEVVDLFWDKYGRYLITTSADQTTRIHASWILNKSTNDCWYEISRPQIHGYNMSCITMITPNLFASGAEEKVARIFVAPLTFQKYLKSITNCNKQYTDLNSTELDNHLSFDIKLFKNLTINDDLDENSITADSASVPALGLTNKAVFHKDEVKEESLSIGSSLMLDYSRPPLEEELIQHTLWPEVEKLYGHGYELFAMAATTDGQLLATACKALCYEHAAIILWDTKTWFQVQKLYFHQLTITQLEFSNDNKYLLAVSRDRLWSLYEQKDGSYELVANMKRNCLHKRIIWCCSWTKHSLNFVTGSRDGKIGMWNVNDIENYTSLETNGGSVTALSFAQTELSDLPFYTLAVGFESGFIEIYVSNKNIIRPNRDWKKIKTFDTSFAHHSTIKRLKFRPLCVPTTVLQLASCGSDNTVKVYELDLTMICKHFNDVF